jgi:hypothetical protein
MVRSVIPTSLLCVGAGGTMGPEAPLVQTNGTLGSWVAGKYGLDPADVRGAHHHRHGRRVQRVVRRSAGCRAVRPGDPPPTGSPVLRGPGARHHRGLGRPRRLLRRIWTRAPPGVDPSPGGKPGRCRPRVGNRLWPARRRRRPDLRPPGEHGETRHLGDFSDLVAGARRCCPRAPWPGGRPSRSPTASSRWRRSWPAASPPVLWP